MAHHSLGPGAAIRVQRHARLWRQWGADLRLMPGLGRPLVRAACAVLVVVGGVALVDPLGSASQATQIVPVGGTPVGIAVGPAGTTASGFVYVGNPGQTAPGATAPGAVDVIATGTGATCLNSNDLAPCVVQVEAISPLIGSSSLPAGESLAVSPDGKWLLVGGSSGASEGVEVYPIGSGLLGPGAPTTTSVSNQVSEPAAITVASEGPTAGDAWIASPIDQQGTSSTYAAPLLGSFSSGGAVVGEVSGLPGGQTDVAVAPDGETAYFTMADAAGTPELAQVTIGGTSWTPSFSVSAITGPFTSGIPYGVAVTPGGGHVWITDQFNNQVDVAPTAGLSSATSWAVFPSGGLNPTSVAISPTGGQAVVVNQGNLLLGGTNDGSVAVVQTSTVQPGGNSPAMTIFDEASGASIVAPQQVAVAPDGSVAYVTNEGNVLNGEAGFVSVVPLAPATTQPLAITSTSPLPPAVLGSRYSASLSATGGSGGYAWAVTSGSLPTGLVLSREGVISGEPVAAGSTTFTVTVTDSEGDMASANFTLVAGCTTTLGGTHAGPLAITEGVVCLQGATVTGPVSISGGADVVISSSTLDAPVSDVGGGILNLCGSELGASLDVQDATGFVAVGGTPAYPETPGCEPNAIAGTATFVGNAAGVLFGGNTVVGPTTVDTNQVNLSLAASEKVTAVAGNTIGGYLSCVDNNPAATDFGVANSVAGPAAGQCAGLVDAAQNSSWSPRGRSHP